MRRWIVPVLLWCVAAAPAAAQDLDRPLPVDPGVRIGHLDNGFTYYLRHNDRPEHRVELRLAVNAGSLQEDDDQQGLAHFLEHMEFNGTENFAAGELVDYLESVGARFGPDLNAYTSFDETVFMLQIPTDKAGLLDKGILILRDWASRALLQPAEVDKERGVVLEEWRGGLGVQERLRQKEWPVLFAGSRYAERLPIGKPEIIETAPAERIRSFYADWYRPDLMALVAVGDIDVDAMEAVVQKTFGDLTGPAHPRERVVYDVPYHADPRVVVAADPEQTYTQVWVAFKRPMGKQGTLGAYREGLRDLLVTSMLNQRLAELARNPNPPFLFGTAAPGGFVRDQDMFSVFGATREGGAATGVEALMTEVARVRAHGFGEEELERARNDVLAFMEKAYNERDKNESEAFAAEYLRNFLEDEDIPGIEAEYTMARDLLPGIGLDDIHIAVEQLVHEDNTVVVTSVPEKEGLESPDPGSLLASAMTAFSSTPEAYADSAVGELMTELPPQTAIRDRRELPDLGVTAVTLANGVEVWIKPTDFKNDEIVFGAQSAGGTSLASRTDYPSADVAGSIVAEGGYGGHTPTELQKILSGKIVSVSPFFGLFTQGIRGRTTPKDLETALQATYLVWTAPNRRPESFQVFTDRLRSFVENRNSDPEARYGDRLQWLLRDGNYTADPWSLDRVNRLDLDRALDFYRARFADASAFRFYFVGSIDVDAALPLITRYLGALPARGAGPAVYGNVGLSFPDGDTRDVVRGGTEPKAETTIAWPARISGNEMDMYRLRLAADILEIRLRDRLREELGSTYSVGVGYNYMLPYPDYALLTVNFGSAPEKVDGMVAVVFEEAARFEEEGPTAEELDKVKELDRRSVETGLRENGYWMGSFQTLDLLGWDSARVLHRLDRIDEVTLEDMRATLDGAFPTERRVVVSLLPEGSGQP